MKKVNYLIVLLFSLMFLNTSCEKEEIGTPDVPVDTTTVAHGITAADLVGDWNFVSLDFNGDIITECNQSLCYDAQNPNGGYLYITLNLNITNDIITTFSDCTYSGDPSKNLKKECDFTVANNTITLSLVGIVQMKFEIINANVFNGAELKLKLTEGINSKYPVGGTYTLRK
jgi:hypothetical protein